MNVEQFPAYDGNISSPNITNILQGIIKSQICIINDLINTHRV
jgi:hypothetical protein